MYLFLAQLAAETQKVTLIHDLGAVMLVAGLVAALFHYLGWSKVIGYIVAGALMTNLHSSIIKSVESINVLANLGVIFLMFTLGLELRLHKLKKISNTTAIMRLERVCCMVRQ